MKIKQKMGIVSGGGYCIFIDSAVSNKRCFQIKKNKEHLNQLIYTNQSDDGWNVETHFFFDNNAIKKRKRQK